MTIESGDNIDSLNSSQDENFDETWSEPDQTTLEVYETLMRSRLPSIPPAIRTDDNAGSAQKDPIGNIGEADRPMTKSEKQNAKKKRRKERERTMKLGTESRAQEAITESTDVEAIPFRLYSTRPVEAVQLGPFEEDYPVPANPRHIPLPTAITERVSHIAEISTYTPIPPAFSRPISTRTIPLTQPHPLTRIIHILPPSHTASTTIKSGQVPRLATTSSHEQQKLSTRQRRRLRSTRDQLQAKFWAPAIGIGGKSKGYGWGWRSSQEGRREEGRGYLRSKGV